MGKTHSFTKFIYNIVLNINSSNLVKDLTDNQIAPTGFNVSDSLNGYIFLPDDKGKQISEIVSLYTTGIDSKFIVDYSTYPSISGTMMLANISFYYTGTSPVSINNPANLMINQPFIHNTLSGSFSIISRNKPGFTIVSGYDQTNNDNSKFYHFKTETDNEKETISEQNSFEENIKYDFKIIGTSKDDTISIQIKKETDIEYNSHIDLDRNSNEIIGIMANSNLIINKIIMINN